MGPWTVPEAGQEACSLGLIDNDVLMGESFGSDTAFDVDAPVHPSHVADRDGLLQGMRRQLSPEPRLPQPAVRRRTVEPLAERPGDGHREPAQPGKPVGRASNAPTRGFLPWSVHRRRGRPRRMPRRWEAGEWPLWTRPSSTASTRTSRRRSSWGS